MERERRPLRGLSPRDEAKEAADDAAATGGEGRKGALDERGGGRLPARSGGEEGCGRDGGEEPKEKEREG